MINLPTLAVCSVALQMMAILSLSPVQAQDEPSGENVETVPTVDAVEPVSDGSLPITAADVNAWLDGFMPYALATGDVVGAVVTIVKDGDVLVNRGFGYADLENRVPVDPDQTLFRTGSISKLFIWTAVMQLVEQGRLGLDEDINSYLDFTFPAARGTVTMRHLMTHTPGFQEVLKDLFVEGRVFADEDLREYLVSNIPPQIFDPGTIPAYSNYASALAGYIVERVSGQPFATYVTDNIFVPLSMEHSSFRQPLPDELSTLMSKGYKTRSDGAPQPFEVLVPMPVGALSATGADMARFMISHLNGGEGLVLPETAHRMHTTLHNQFPPVNGLALGFYRVDRNGLNIVSHSGDTGWFHSDLFLILDHGVGVYVSLNSAGAAAASPIRSNLLNAFVDRYFPAVEQAITPLDTALEHGRAVAGLYEISRAAETNAFAVARYASQIPVSVDDDAVLSVPFIRDYAGAAEPLYEVTPWVWQTRSGRRVAARVKDGQVMALAADPAYFAATPVPWHRSSAWLTPFATVSLLVIAITFLAWPVGAVVRRHFGVGFSHSDPGSRLAYRLAPLASLLVLAYLSLWAVFVTWVSASLFNLEGERSVFWLSVLYALSILPVAALGMAGLAAWIKCRQRQSLFTKISSVTLVVAIGVIIWLSVAVGFFSFNTQF